jgi:hypothetical protein
LKSQYNLKIKGDGPIEYHLGCTYRHDPDGTLIADPKRYVDKLMDNFFQTFGHKPKKARPPLTAKDHPELDDSELLCEKGIKLYQSMIGQLQWLISLGRFDIASAVMSLSTYRAAPRQAILIGLNVYLDIYTITLMVVYVSRLLNQTTVIFLNKTLIGIALYTAMFMKSCLQTSLHQWGAM